MLALLAAGVGLWSWHAREWDLRGALPEHGTAYLEGQATAGARAPLPAVAMDGASAGLCEATRFGTNGAQHDDKKRAPHPSWNAAPAKWTRRKGEP